MTTLLEQYAIRESKMWIAPTDVGIMAEVMCKLCFQGFHYGEKTERENVLCHESDCNGCF